MYTPRRSAVWLSAPLLDLAGSVLSFLVRSLLGFISSYTLEGITAMQRGLHARLCHAVLVTIIMLLIRLGRGGKYCGQRACVSVCLFVCLFARLSQKPHVQIS